MNKINEIYSYIDFEALFWITALVVLAFSNPYSETHYTLFLPSLLFDIQSPGHGLGHSISHFFHGNIRESIDAHVLGIVTIGMLSWRSFYLLKKSYNNKVIKESYHG